MSICKAYGTVEERCAAMPPVPEDFYKWVEESVLNGQKHGVYTCQGRRTAEVFCCACGNRYTVKRTAPETYEECMCSAYMPLARNETSICLKCGAKILMHTGRQKEEYHEKEDAYIMQPYGNGGAVIRWIEAYRRWGPGMKEKILYTELGRAFFLPGYISVQKDYDLWDSYRGKDFWSDKNIGGLRNIAFPWAMIYPGSWGQLKGTVLEYSGLPDYLRRDAQLNPRKIEAQPVRYMEKYVEYPVLELLCRKGCIKIANRILKWEKIGFRNARKAKTAAEMMGINKNRIADVLRSDDFTLLKWFQYEHDIGKAIDTEIMEWFEGEYITPADLDFIKDRMSLVKIKNYLSKHSGTNKAALLRTWSDYMEMAKKLNYDPDDEIVYKPKDINAAHAKLVEEINRGEVEKEAAKIRARFKNAEKNLRAVIRKFEYANEEYTIRVPQSINEILVEGRTLHHCVSSDRYFERIDTKESYILFLRRSGTPDTPFYTLEIEPDGSIRQKRTEYDRQDGKEEITEFLKEYQGALAKRVNKNDREAAARSRELYHENMIEFYQKDAERASLVDADYMEIDIDALLAAAE